VTTYELNGAITAVSLDLTELRELLTALNKTDIAELILKSDDFELTVRRGLLSDAGQPGLVQVSPNLMSAPVMVAPLPVADASRSSEGGSDASMVPASPPSHDRRLVDILSPMVGTFYRAPGPDDSPFVEVGDRVRAGQTVCIIEAMKLMNELEAEVTGEIVEILIQNGQPVEYGQPLMRVNPT
jgi:acetyl-CoA carboxylase biotin carboxyl carrier protein